MSIQSLFRALFVPAFILVMTGLYWLSVVGAPSSAQRVPRVIILFILLMCALVTIKEVKKLRDSATEHPSGESVLITVKAWLTEHGQRVACAVISIGYYPAFMWLGFNIANVIFLALALPLAGLGARLKPLPRAALALGAACRSSVAAL